MEREARRIIDLTVEELVDLLQQTTRDLVQAEVRELLGTGYLQCLTPRPPLNLPLDDLGEWPEGFTELRDGRDEPI